MPDYLITMDTGDQYLCHHGTKGMKWGVWNDETASRYAGGLKNPSKAKANAKYVAKTLGAGAAMVTAGTALGAAGGALAGPVGAKAGLGAGVGGAYGALQGARNVAKLKRDGEIAEAEKRKAKAESEKPKVKEKVDGKVDKALKVETKDKPHWKDVDGETLPMNSKGWTPSSYSKKNAKAVFGEHADTYIRKNIDTYEELASKYNRDNKEDVKKVLKLEQKALTDHEYYSDFGNRKQAAEATGKYDAYSDWRRSGTQADFEDWYDRRMY